MNFVRVLAAHFWGKEIPLEATKHAEYIYSILQESIKSVDFVVYNDQLMTIPEFLKNHARIHID